MSFRFRKLLADDLEMVLRWRTQPDVARQMLTEVEFNMDRQRQWFAGISASTRAEYWIIDYAGVAVGLLSLTDIDRRNRHASWGFYIGEASYRSLGGLVPCCFYNYVFNRADLNLRKLVGEVLDGNENIMRIHRLFGYRHVGVYRDHVWKDSRFHDVHLVELLREDWEKNSGILTQCSATFE
jgi:UDP-4-amino-4,6-dideoxy-N-acetyl-beta-L-altrosamine N-acetyltransferase